MSGPVSDREIGAVVSALSPKEACRFLIDLANLQGGPDNITVVVARVQGDGSRKNTNHDLVPKAVQQVWQLPAHWPLASLLGGIVLALAAIGMTYAQVGGGVVLFLLGVAALGAGIVGLLLQNRRENKSIADDNDLPSLHVHRRFSCAIELPLLKKLERAEELLAERISGAPVVGGLG